MSESRPRTHNPWLTVIVVCIAQLMVVLDATIVNVALPSIQRSLHISAGNLQWIINAYTLTFGGFLLLGGRAGDVFGRRRLFFAGIVLFSLASLVNGLADSAGMLIASRAVQGLGAAMVSPATLAIVNTTFSDPEGQRRALGLWAGLSAGGSAVGLLLGGVLTQAFSWPWIFFVNIPIGVLGILLALRFVPDSRVEGADRSADIAGAISITGGLALLIYSIVGAEQHGWGSLQTLGLGGVALALIGSFVLVERRVSVPLVRLSVFGHRALAVGNASMLFIVAGLFANFFFGTLYVQNILHFTPIGAGLAFLPVAVLIAVGAGLAQGLIPRLGIRPVAIAGIVIAAAGLLLMLRVNVDSTYAGTLLPSFIALAVGMGIAFVPATMISVNSVGADDQGLASGLLNTSQQVGGALGLAILSTIAVSHTAGLLAGVAHPSVHAQAVATVAGYRLGYAVASGFMLIAIAVLVLFLRDNHLESLELHTAPEPAAA
jgi:EmrB/QacA subfamily drug resistance transporter